MHKAYFQKYLLSAGPAACGIPEVLLIRNNFRNSLRRHPQLIISFEINFMKRILCQTF